MHWTPTSDCTDCADVWLECSMIKTKKTKVAHGRIFARHRWPASSQRLVLRQRTSIGISSTYIGAMMQGHVAAHYICFLGAIDCRCVGNARHHCIRAGERVSKDGRFRGQYAQRLQAGPECCQILRRFYSFHLSGRVSRSLHTIVLRCEIVSPIVGTFRVI